MIKLGIIYGGISTEHDVSIMSAKSILENLNKKIWNTWNLYKWIWKMVWNTKWRKRRNI